jgi:predicted adenine nucleotide alpha hydrolase (AANH) superfamily ATPase
MLDTHTYTTAFLIPDKKVEKIMQIGRRVWKNEHVRYKNTTVQTKTEKETSRTISRVKREF